MGQIWNKSVAVATLEEIATWTLNTLKGTVLVSDSHAHRSFRSASVHEGGELHKLYSALRPRSRHHPHHPHHHTLDETEDEEQAPSSAETLAKEGRSPDDDGHVTRFLRWLLRVLVGRPDLRSHLAESALGVDRSSTLGGLLSYLATLLHEGGGGEGEGAPIQPLLLTSNLALLTLAALKQLKGGQGEQLNTKAMNAVIPLLLEKLPHPRQLLLKEAIPVDPLVLRAVTIFFRESWSGSADFPLFKEYLQQLLKSPGITEDALSVRKILASGLWQK